MQGALRVDEALRRPLDLCPICLRKLQHLLGFRLVDRYKVSGRGRNAVNGRGRGGNEVRGRGRGRYAVSGQGAVWTPALSLRGLSGSG